MENSYRKKLQEVIDKIGLESAIKIAKERLAEINTQPEDQQDKVLIRVYKEFLDGQTNN
jgi:hypothetical protein